MGLLADGAQLLADLQGESDGETVRISRPNVFGPVNCTAVMADPETRIDSSSNLPVRIEAGRIDMLFRSIDLLAALGIGVTIQKNDRIDRTIGTRNYRYVVSPDEGDPAWEFGDPDQITVRAHTRLAEVT